MKWKLEKPASGSIRTVRKFAWLPVEIEDHKVWLETFETKEVYQRVGRKMEWGEIAAWNYELDQMTFPERKLLYTCI